VNSRDVEIHEAIEGVVMKGSIKIEQSSSLMNIRLIQNILTIK
jgi:hypothetical protein